MEASIASTYARALTEGKKASLGTQIETCKNAVGIRELNVVSIRSEVISIWFGASKNTV